MSQKQGALADHIILLYYLKQVSEIKKVMKYVERMKSYPEESDMISEKIVAIQKDVYMIELFK